MQMKMKRGTVGKDHSKGNRTSQARERGRKDVKGQKWTAAASERSTQPTNGKSSLTLNTASPALDVKSRGGKRDLSKGVMSHCDTVLRMVLDKIAHRMVLSTYHFRPWSFSVTHVRDNCVGLDWFPSMAEGTPQPILLQLWTPVFKKVTTKIFIWICVGMHQEGVAQTLRARAKGDIPFWGKSRRNPTKLTQLVTLTQRVTVRCKATRLVLRSNYLILLLTLLAKN